MRTLTQSKALERSTKQSRTDLSSSVASLFLFTKGIKANLVDLPVQKTNSLGGKKFFTNYLLNYLRYLQEVRTQDDLFYPLVLSFLVEWFDDCYFSLLREKHPHLERHLLHPLEAERARLNKTKQYIVKFHNLSLLL